MASRPVPSQYLTAGKDYLEALKDLGLTPAYMGWGWDTIDKQWLLVMITSIIEAGGPLALNRLLFRAYNAKATPKEISPFIVRIFSPEVIGAQTDFWLLGAKKGVAMMRVRHADGRPALNEKGMPIGNVQKTFMGIELEMINSYEGLPGETATTVRYHERHKQWQRFKKNIERLAA